MLKVNIDKNNAPQIITATGDISEMLNDIAILIGGVYKQLQSADHLLAHMFRYGLIGMVNDPSGPIWGGPGNSIGVIVKKD